MSVLIRVGIPVLLAICCGDPHANAYPSVSSTRVGTYEVGPPTDQPALENRLESPVRLAPSPADRGHGYTALLSEPFGVQVIATQPNEISEKWTELQSRIEADEATLATCRSGDGPCPTAALRFLSIIELGRRRQGRARLGEINRAVNLSIRPMSDWVQYGVGDFWASPLATMSSGAGDCEDYAIVKYVALRESGTAPEDLRLLIVHDAKHRTDHAVVAVRHEGDWLLLDNRTLILVNADDAQAYLPLFVLDHRGVRTLATAFLRR